jgi:hypothetical protein
MGGEPCNITSNLTEGWDFRESPMMALVLEKNLPNVFSIYQATEDTPCLDSDLAGQIGTVLRVPMYVLDPPLTVGTVANAYGSPVSYISGVQQERFWDNYFSVYGISALHQIPQRVALRIDMSGPGALANYFMDLGGLAPTGDDGCDAGALPDTEAQAAQTLLDAKFEDRVLGIDRAIKMLDDWTLL